MLGATAARPSIAVGLVREKLDEPQPGAAVFARTDLDLVGERADDLDPEAALLELVVVPVAVLELETGPLVPDLDHEPVGLQLVDDLDVALPPILIRMPH